MIIFQNAIIRFNLNERRHSRWGSCLHSSSKVHLGTMTSFLLRSVGGGDRTLASAVRCVRVDNDMRGVRLHFEMVTILVRFNLNIEFTNIMLSLERCLD